MGRRLAKSRMSECTRSQWRTFLFLTVRNSKICAPILDLGGVNENVASIYICTIPHHDIILIQSVIQSFIEWARLN